MMQSVVGVSFDVLVIVGPRKDSMSLEYGVVLANDEDSVHTRKRGTPRFYTHALRVPRAGQDPGSAFYAEAERLWGRPAKFLNLSWGAAEKVADAEGYENTKGVYLLRLDQEQICRIVRSVKEHDWLVVSKEYILRRMKTYYSRKYPDTRSSDLECGYMRYPEFMLLKSVLPRAWPKELAKAA